MVLKSNEKRRLAADVRFAGRRLGRRRAQGRASGGRGMTNTRRKNGDRAIPQGRPFLGDAVRKGVYDVSLPVKETVVVS